MQESFCNERVKIVTGVVVVIHGSINSDDNDLGERDISNTVVGILPIY